MVLLEKELVEIKAHAESIAGKSADMVSRSKALVEMYLDSNKNYVFPQLAAHGALWAQNYFSRTGPVAKLTSYRYFYNRSEREKRYRMILDFREGLLIFLNQPILNSKIFLKKKNGLIMQ
ncbi:hypothetical protein HY837_05905 [archaeon]|nr:hypothetical protein [archaeon]